MRTPLFLTALLLLSLAANCQHNAFQRNVPYFDERQIFTDCADALPRLYDRRDFDSIAFHLRRRLAANASFQTDVYALRILLLIQQHRFTPDSAADAQLYTAMDQYVVDATASQSEWGFSGIYAAGWDFDSRPYYQEEYATLAHWAEDLLETRRLHNGESFLCQVFAGDFEHPRKTAENDRARYWQMNEMLDASIVSRRKGHSYDGYIGAGVWIPQGRLARLGVHPSVTAFSFGRKYGAFEWDITLAFKFVSTSQSYTVLRQDSLYNVHNFFGGYFGLDFTRFVVETRRFAIGPMFGIGIDGFDVNDSYTDSQPVGPPPPTSINSLNLNTGIRFQYFINPTHYIGLVGRYNFVQYSNPGGTPLDGNTVTVDLVFGFN